MSFRDVVENPILGPPPFRWRMGVRRIGADAWLQPDDARPEDLARKRILIGERRAEMVAALEEATAACEELWVLVDTDLRRRGLGPAATDGHPIDAAGRSVQEDFCVLQPGTGGWVLVAGSVCFPTRWSLPDKMGRTLAAIHAPVPGYREQIGAAVERSFDRMQAGTITARLNWSLVGDDARRLEPDVRQAPRQPPSDLGRDLHLRVERQTLRRLRHSAAVAFGIRIHSWPLGEVADEIPSAALADVVSTVPAEVAAYKDLEGFRAPLITWLRARTERGFGPSPVSC